ncbi:MAG: hypothetical protein KJ734_14470, partial [Chloroflexi bacterium]|nr:hypothetical protein [Chloroflexota bacterium]
AAGTAALPNQVYGVRVYGNTQGNLVGMDWDGNGARNVISGNGQHGVVLSGAGVTRNMVGFNYIGTRASGLAPVGNTQFGVFVENGAHNNGITGNVIADNSTGIWVEGSGTVQNFVDGNLVGVAADDTTPLGNTDDGIHISIGAQGNGVFANHIAYNGGDGVAVDTPTAFDNDILFNSIHDNTGLGIHLTNGANHGIDAPLITDFDPEHRIVSGSACPGCIVDVYASRNNDGEGEDYLWWALAGPAGDFAVTLPRLPYAYLTATATGAADGTSEFSDVFTGTILIHLPLIVKNF